MRTIEATATIRSDRTLTVHVPPDITPGEHHIVVIIDEQPTSPPPPCVPPLLEDFPVWDCGPWPVDWSLRREDLYDDDGR